MIANTTVPASCLESHSQHIMHFPCTQWAAFVGRCFAMTRQLRLEQGSRWVPNLEHVHTTAASLSRSAASLGDAAQPLWDALIQHYRDLSSEGTAAPTTVPNGTPTLARMPSAQSESWSFRHVATLGTALCVTSKHYCSNAASAPPSQLATTATPRKVTRRLPHRACKGRCHTI